MPNEENKNNRIYNKESVDQINKMFEDALENNPLGNHGVLDIMDVVSARTDPTARQRIIDLIERVKERITKTTLNEKFGIKEGRETPVLNANLFLSEISSEFEKIGLPRLDGVPIPPMDYPRIDPDPVMGEISIRFEEMGLPWKDDLPNPGCFDPFEELPTLHYRRLDLSNLSSELDHPTKLLGIGADFEPVGGWCSGRFRGLSGDLDGDTLAPYHFYNLVDNLSLRRCTRYPINRSLIIFINEIPSAYDPYNYPDIIDRLPSRTKYRKLSGRRKRLVVKMIEYGTRRSELGMIKEYELSRK